MIVTGIDLASVHSAICTLEVPPPAPATWMPMSYKVVELDWIDVKEDTTYQRIKAAYAFLHVVEEYKPQLVVIEDYTHQRRSFDSYNVGELGGMMRLLLYQAHHTCLFVSPMRLKEFLHFKGKTPIAKEAVRDAVSGHFGYICGASVKKHREDATDAFALAQLGRAFLAYRTDDDSLTGCKQWASPHQRKAILSLQNDPDLLLRGEHVP